MARKQFFKRMEDISDKCREMEREESKNIRNKGLLSGVLLGAILYVYTGSHEVIVVSMLLGMMLGVGMDRRSKSKKDRSAS